MIDVDAQAGHFADSPSEGKLFFARSRRVFALGSWGIAAGSGLADSSKGGFCQHERSWSTDGKRNSALAAGALALKRHDPTEPVLRMGHGLTDVEVIGVGLSECARGGQTVRPDSELSGGREPECRRRESGSRFARKRRPRAVGLPRPRLGRADSGKIADHDRALGKLSQKLRRLARLRLAAECSHAAVAQVELAASAGNPHEKKSPFLFHIVAILEHPLVRQQALFDADDENHRKLESLGRVQRHQGDCTGVFVPAVDRRGQADLGQEVLDPDPPGAARRIRARR